MQFVIEDPNLAQALRNDRLLTSSLRHEPTFKHEVIDDPDEVMATLEKATPKKARKVKRFNFMALLPLVLTMDEVRLAFDLRRITLHSLSAHACRVEPWNEEHVVATRQILDRCFTSKCGYDMNRQHVFRALWEGGYTLVDGLKFGVDFLAYRGDALKTHADYMVLVVAPHTPPISMMDATAMCTLAAKTRKMVILGWCDDQGKAQFMQLLREPVNVILERNAMSQEERMLDEIPTIEALEHPLPYVVNEREADALIEDVAAGLVDDDGPTNDEVAATAALPSEDVDDL